VQLAPLVDSAGDPTDRVVVCWTINSFYPEAFGFDESLDWTYEARFCRVLVASGSALSKFNSTLRLTGFYPRGSVRGRDPMRSLRLAPLDSGRVIACYVAIVRLPPRVFDDYTFNRSMPQGICRLLTANLDGNLTGGEELAIGPESYGSSIVAVGSLGRSRALTCHWRPVGDGSGRATCAVVSAEAGSNALQNFTSVDLNGGRPVNLWPDLVPRPIFLDIAALGEESAVVFWQHDEKAELVAGESPRPSGNEKQAEVTIGGLLQVNGTDLAEAGTLGNFRPRHLWFRQSDTPDLTRVAAVALGNGMPPLMCSSEERIGGGMQCGSLLVEEGTEEAWKTIYIVFLVLGIAIAVLVVFALSWFASRHLCKQREDKMSASNSEQVAESNVQGQGV